MATTTTTPALSSGAASLAITTPAVIAGTVATAPDPNNNPFGIYTIVTGTGQLPVYGAAPDGTKTGAFLTQTPDFVGSWVLSRRTSGVQGAGVPVQQVVLKGDATLLQFCGAGPLVTLTSLDQITLTITARTSGSMTMAMVQ